jgi:hypothetical protein
MKLAAQSSGLGGNWENGQRSTALIRSLRENFF